MTISARNLLVTATQKVLNALKGAFTAGSVLFADADGGVSEDNAALFWDQSNKRLGIGTAVPAASLHVAGGLKIATNNTSTILAAAAAHWVLENTGSQTLGVFTFGGVEKGGVRGDSSGNFNWHAVGYHQFYNALNTANPILNLSASGVNVGGGAGVAASETLTVTGKSITGSASTSTVGITATWNTTGAPTAIKLNVTDTASDAASKLLYLQVDAASKFYVRKDGMVSMGTHSAIGAETVTGYITILDSAGSPRKLAVVS